MRGHCFFRPRKGGSALPGHSPIMDKHINGRAELTRIALRGEVIPFPHRSVPAEFKILPQIPGGKSGDGVSSDGVGHAKHAREDSPDVSPGFRFNPGG
jgi:hypothetical protein